MNYGRRRGPGQQVPGAWPFRGSSSEGTGCPGSETWPFVLANVNTPAGIAWPLGRPRAWGHRGPSGPAPLRTVSFPRPPRVIPVLRSSHALRTVPGHPTGTGVQGAGLAESETMTVTASERDSTSRTRIPKVIDQVLTHPALALIFFRSLAFLIENGIFKKAFPLQSNYYNFVPRIF